MTHEIDNTTPTVHSPLVNVPHPQGEGLGHPVKQGASEPKKESESNETYSKADRIGGESTDIHITNVPPTPLPPVNPNAGATVGTSSVLQEMNGLESQPGQVNEEIFEEIPVEVCGQLYQTALEVGFSLKHKGMPMRELPETRVNTQAKIIYGILKKNQISVKHIDLFMLGAGMMGDWKYMGTLAAEQERENEFRDNGTGENK